MKLALTGARIFDGFQLHSGSALLVDDERITGIIPATELDVSYPTLALNSGVLAPGFIDLQINGAGGVLLNNAPTAASMITMADAVAPFGVTRIFPTVISDDATVTEKAISAAKALTNFHSGVLGLHIEGPFFSLEKNGVHRPEKIRPLEESDWDWLAALSEIPSLLTLAPEVVPPEHIHRISQLGVRVCAGHSNASFEQVVKAYQQGLTGFTHLFNAMSPMTGREPGVVGAALALPETKAGLIADGIHVHPASMQAAIKAKGYDNIFLVSDAMATVGSKQKSFELYGESIRESDGRLVNSQGRLAGAVITLLDAVTYCRKKLDLPLTQCLAMASRVPAEFMRLGDRFGSFKAGTLADICWLSEDLKVNKVWRTGELVADHVS